MGKHKAKGAGGRRTGAGRKNRAVPFKERRFRVPAAYYEQAVQEMCEIIKKYKDKCRTSN